MFHAIELKRLVNRFAGVDMRTVAPDARAKWLAMLEEHASSLQWETAALRQQLQPVLFAGSSLQVSAEVSIQSDADFNARRGATAPANAL